jgi:antitoxin component YwqK of YwqJK toxin-antitoxin module
MKQTFTILLFLFGFNLLSQTALYTNNDGDNIIEYTLQGEDGKVIETGYYLNNKMHGTWTSYYPSGKTQAIVKFKNGLRHGKWSFFDESGRVLMVVTYDNNKKIMATQNQYATK